MFVARENLLCDHNSPHFSPSSTVYGSRNVAFAEPKDGGKQVCI